MAEEYDDRLFEELTSWDRHAYNPDWVVPESAENVGPIVLPEPNPDMVAALASVADALRDEDECPLGLLLASALGEHTYMEVIGTLVPTTRALLNRWHGPEEDVTDALAVALRWADCTASVLEMDIDQLQELAVAAELVLCEFSCPVESDLGHRARTVSPMSLLCRVSQMCIVVSVAVATCLGGEDTVRGGDAIRWTAGLAIDPWPDATYTIGD